MAKSLHQEAPPAYADVERLYAAAGVELPAVALRRFDDVKAFQASVATNRRQYLQAQINEVTDRRDGLARELEAAAAERTKILQSLDGKGAFEDLIRLREGLGELAGRAETCGASFSTPRCWRATRLGAQGRRGRARVAASAKLRSLGRCDQTGYCASRPRDLDLVRRSDRQPNCRGFPHRSEVPHRHSGWRQQGRHRYDEAFLLRYRAAPIAPFDRFSPGPRMLVHDSHLFDGVDSRQVARALTYGHVIAQEIAGQYIVALNSDEFEKASVLKRGAAHTVCEPSPGSRT